MTKTPLSASESALKNFWNDLLNTPMIPVTNLLKLNDKLFKVLLRVQELTQSRNKWRLRAEQAEKKLKEMNK